MSCRNKVPCNLVVYLFSWGTAVAQLLRCCATNRKVAGSIPDGVIGIFHWHNPYDRTMALGSTQPLTEMRPRGFPGGKCGRCIGLTTLPPSCAVVMKSGNLNFLKPSGPPHACNGTVLPYLFSWGYSIPDVSKAPYFFDTPGTCYPLAQRNGALHNTAVKRSRLAYWL